MSSLLALALLFAPALPPAPGENVEGLRWRAPAGCPDAGALRERITTLVQRELQADELSLDAEVRAELDGFAVDLRIVAGTLVDERTLHAADCETLADAAALVGAVLLDPIVTTATVDVESAVAAAVEVPTPVPAPRTKPPLRVRRGDKPNEPVVVTPEPPRAKEPRDRELAAWLRARAGVQFGAVPGVTGGFDLAIGIGTRRVRGELAGSWWIPQRVDDPIAPITVQLGTIAPRVCATAPQRRIDVVACGGIEVGVMRAKTRGFGVQQPVWLAIDAEAGIRAPLTGRLSIWATAMATIPVLFPEFRIELPDGRRAANVYRPAPAGVRGLLGLEVRLRGLDKRK
ncbi:MAG TPA: hypothetical protein VG755_20915 [Nannocystaceae bacterium]|nr:hypothetical protein [Nannocystaceae bacterium]